MKQSKSILFGASIVSFALLGVALYLQFGQGMQPCPWCVIQRYLFAAIAVICLIAALLPGRFTRAGAGVSLLAALGGIAAAAWLLWVKAHPSVSCGIDPLETSLNKVFTARWLPFLFRADGFCTTEYAPVLGLTVAQWSLVWFVVLALVLGWTAFKRRR